MRTTMPSLILELNIHDRITPIGANLANSDAVINILIISLYSNNLGLEQFCDVR